MPPAGFKRSRALWDQTQERREGVVNHLQSLFRAILYEMQPIRYSQVVVYKDSALTSTRSVKKTLSELVQKTVPVAASNVYQWLRGGMSMRQWGMVVAVLLYYGFVRWIHYALDAGPIVLIITALIAIFTIGLSDNNGGSDGLSAYSVFNKGFQKLMGSVDADSLLQQHVGGGLVGFMAGGAGGAVEQAVQPEEQRRGPPARFRPQQQQRAPENINDDDEPDDRAQTPPPPPNDANNRARKSGKKARRGTNLEQRREMRRQREAAIAMGFGGGNDDATAMNRLIEDQVLAAAAVQQDG